MLENGKKHTALNGENSGEQITEALKYLHAEFLKSPTLEEVSAKCGFQQNYFCRKFKASTGKTYKEYLTDLKINYAKRLLKSGNFTTTELCYACGFNTVSSFLAQFKKATGETPKSYLKSQV